MDTHVITNSQYGTIDRKLTPDMLRVDLGVYPDNRPARNPVWLNALHETVTRRDTHLDTLLRELSKDAHGDTAQVKMRYEMALERVWTTTFIIANVINEMWFAKLSIESIKELTDMGATTVGIYGETEVLESGSLGREGIQTAVEMLVKDIAYIETRRYSHFQVTRGLTRNTVEISNSDDGHIYFTTKELSSAGKRLLRKS